MDVYDEVDRRENDAGEPYLFLCIFPLWKEDVNSEKKTTPQDSTDLRRKY